MGGAGNRANPRCVEGSVHFRKVHLMSFSESTTRATSSKRAKTVEEVSDQLDELRSHMQSVAASVKNVAKTKASDTQQKLETAIKENPFAAVAIAAGAGFLYAMIRR